MKRYYRYLCYGIISLSLCACSHNHEADHEHHHGQEHGHHHNYEAVSAHDHATHEEHEDGEDKNPNEIVLQPEAAQAFNVQTLTVEPSDFESAIKVSGQIVDSPSSSAIVSAPTSGIVNFSDGIASGKEVSNNTVIATIVSDGVTGGNPNENARIAYEAAKKELDRVTPLHQEGIVSTKDYNAALQAYQLAKAAYSKPAATGKAIAASSGVITQLMAMQGQYVEAGAPLASISSTKRLTLRADVPERYFKEVPYVQSAQIELPYDDEVIDIRNLKGQRVGHSVTAQNGYVPVYFNFDNNGAAIPGSFVKAYLITSTRHDVISVPLIALSEQQGAFFVYEKLDDECYKKIPVTLGATNGTNAEITSGLHGGEEIVVNGVVGVRLAETSTVAPEGHSHNH